MKRDDMHVLAAVRLLTELGVPPADHALFSDWSRVLATHSRAVDEHSIAALAPVLEALSACMRELLEHKRREPAEAVTLPLPFHASDAAPQGNRDALWFWAEDGVSTAPHAQV